MMGADEGRSAASGEAIAAADDEEHRRSASSPSSASSAVVAKPSPPEQLETVASTRPMRLAVIGDSNAVRLFTALSAELGDADGELCFACEGTNIADAERQLNRVKARVKASKLSVDGILICTGTNEHPFAKESYQLLVEHAVETGLGRVLVVRPVFKRDESWTVHVVPSKDDLPSGRPKRARQSVLSLWLPAGAASVDTARPYEYADNLHLTKECYAAVARAVLSHCAG